MPDATDAVPRPALRIEPLSLAHVAALLDGPERFRQEFALEVLDGYVEFDGVLEHTARRIDDEGIAPEWLSYLFIDPDGGAVIGLGGFKGPPADGIVEIGYGIAPARRERGYATEAARQLVERAADRGVTTVIAHTLPETNASTGVLGRLGFTRTATVDDPDDGPIWRWELDLGP
jgi:RimJ/RimL family protein N-acetyltransferase